MSRNPVSCLFMYAKKAYAYENGETVPVLNSDGSHRSNDNYLNFLQVISTYWEPVGNPVTGNTLVIFMNGGSISVDQQSGERQMKSGYTVKLPEFLGKRFMEEFARWSCSFGLTSSVAYTPRPERVHSDGPRAPRGIRADDFLDPMAEPEQPAAFE